MGKNDQKRSKFSKLIGSYHLGWENVRVYLTPGFGGSFTLAPGDSGSAFMEIHHGNGDEKWEHVAAVLLHEAMEFSMTRMGCRFLPNPCESQSHAAYVFHMSHEQFAEAAEQTGRFMAKCLPDMEKAFKEMVKLKP